MSRSSRSASLVGAAAALAVCWVACLIAYFLLDGAESLFAALILLNAAMAIYFYRRSRGSWLPVPLCFAHGALCSWYAALCIFELDVRGAWLWTAATANRIFDLEILYVIGAASYRRARLEARARTGERS
ncbi:MAG: hypothetical protein GC152_11640 [Alphaproteobacteria bacterium]|nr:hypothetical protein [Alphaproteobacteria bacterium]